ncbi:hypothetical protein F4813DRAFT_251982 [Daldinia decipiens]|uniref:uncharacterized protein n=1 Tax=Daldinia decipiens TaxID=326647 RepID=UPI0020C2A91F|nr:uncharacterized protein F4813DRAFT_251982 [Daldinia decipiens]KAI1653543.1 hypothetical protein F4813DRAFT_251982 [Daldinia decipiens]
MTNQGYISWMKDLLLRIMVDEEMESTVRYPEVSSFLKSTWCEIPDRTSESRFMRPQFAEKVPIASTRKRQDEKHRGTAANNFYSYSDFDLNNYRCHSYSLQHKPKTLTFLARGQLGNPED